LKHFRNSIEDEHKQHCYIRDIKYIVQDLFTKKMRIAALKETLRQYLQQPEASNHNDCQDQVGQQNNNGSHKPL
jgi:hypothetical protein